MVQDDQKLCPDQKTAFQYIGAGPLYCTLLKTSNNKFTVPTVWHHVNHTTQGSTACYLLPVALANQNNRTQCLLFEHNLFYKKTIGRLDISQQRICFNTSVTAQIESAYDT